MKYALISTYPKDGSLNIGDKLIEQCTVDAIRAFDSNAEIEPVWRAEPWENVRESIAAADHVIFACLAIRAKMDAVYPSLRYILDLGIPLSAISAGTSLSPSAVDLFNAGFTDADLALLRHFSRAAKQFTTRGVLTQAFCQIHGLSKAQLSGDVAFLDARFDKREFKPPNEIRKVIISDPHHGPAYAPAFSRLTQVLRRILPHADFDCALHGVNPEIEALCAELGIAVRPIYLKPESGLDIYDEYHMHAGFRVHGHVSALKRRIPSYLLEQDGRGTDYGLTFSRRLSVPCYRAAIPASKGQRALAGQSPAPSSPSSPLQTAPAKSEKRLLAPEAASEHLGAMILQDMSDAFSRFKGFETEILGFNRRTMAAIQSICVTDTAR